MLIRKTNLRDVKDKWESMYASNHALTPYSSYSFNEIVCQNYRFAPNRFLLQTKIFEVLDDNQDTIMIIPLYGRGERYYLIGDLLMTGHLDFIYKQDISHDEFAQAFQLLKTELKGTKLVLNKISERSRLNDYLASNYPIADKKICVNIHFGRNCEAYIKSLSKNMRRHIRNMRNRLEREAVNWSVEVKINTPIANRIKKEILKVYNDRAVDKNGKQLSWSLKTVRYHFNPITISTAKMEGNFNSILHINGELAAFSSGYVTNDNSTIISPRGAMNNKFSKFSPGLLLDMETIKWLTHNTEITDLDLSRGDEEYKYALGGKEHYNYSYEIEFN